VEHGDAQSIALIDVLDGVLLRWRGVGTKQAARAPARSSLTEEQELERQIALERIVDAVASHDDDFAVAVLSGAAVAPEDYLRALRQAVAARACLPLLYGAARAGVGVAAVADAIVALLPEPDGGASQHCYDRASGSLLPALAAPAPGTPAAFVFKTERRRGGARLAYVRVFAGALASDARLVRLPGGAPWRARQLVRLMGGSEEPVARLEAGMIGGLLDDDPEQLPITGETLAAPGYGCAFERLDPPAPVIAVAVEAPDLEHDRAMREALRALIADDSSLRVTVDPESGQTLLAGMGELHLELTVERLIEVVGVPLAVGSPRPQRRRILASTAAGAGQHDAGTIPAERVEIALIVRPITGGVGHVIRYAGEPPRRPQWREALEAGIHAGLAADRRDPVDVIGVEVSVERVAVTAAEPAPVAFRDAGLAATQQAVLAARPVLAEPWMLLTVVIPDEHVGRVVGDLSRRRARVRSSEQRGPLQVLTVDGPLDGLIGYATALRTLTSGRGIFTMQPAGYLAV
jgi:elongation factor G